MSIRNRRNSVRKSSISIDGIRNSVRLFNKGIAVARNISSDILEKTRERNRFKQTLSAKDNEYFRRRQENIKRKQREDELEAQDVKKLPKTKGNIITRSTRGLLGRLLDFLGVLLVGFVINNLPRIQKAITSVVEKIKKVIAILDPFIKGVQFFLQGIGLVIDNVLKVFKGFDFSKDKKKIEESIESANNNLFKLDQDFIVVTNEFSQDKNLAEVPSLLESLDDEEESDVEQSTSASAAVVLEEPKKEEKSSPIETTFEKPEEIEGRAMGGDAIKGEPYVVGEEGPELFVPEQSGDIVNDDQLGELEGMMGDDEKIQGVKNEDEIAKIKPPKQDDGSGVIPTLPGKESSVSDVLSDQKKKRSRFASVNKNVDTADNVTPVTRTRTSMINRRKRRKTTIMIVEKPAQQSSNPSMVSSGGQGSRIVQGDSKSDVLSSLQGLQLKKN